MFDYSWKRFFLVLVVAVCLPLSVTTAGTISLAWDSVNDPDVAGYKVYFDTVPNTWGNNIDVGMVTAVTLSGLEDCTRYYVALKAYDIAGTESLDFSEVIDGWARPELQAASPQQLQRNTQATVTIDGANFQPGAGVTIADPAIAINGVTLNGCSQLVVDVTVGASAVLGPVTLDVANTDQVFGTAVGLISVVADDAGPVISGLTAGAVGSTTAAIGWTTDEPSNSQVFFRLEGQSSFQTTDVQPELVTEHDIVLQGLRPESTYEYYVRSVDAAGNAGTSNPVQTLATGVSSYDYLRIEAESAEPSAPMQAAAGADAFANGWIEADPAGGNGTAASPAGTADYGFYLPQSGSYTVWLRIYGADPQADSVFEAVDDATFEPVVAGEWGVWQWVRGRDYQLGPGLHTLTLGGREAGTRVDRLLITDDPGFVPTEQPGDDNAAPDSVADASATAGEGANAVSWTNPLDSDSLTLVIRYRTDGLFPASVHDGLPLLEQVVTPGAAGSFDHTSLDNGTTYAYSIFVIDESGNVSEPASVQATPALSPPPPVGGVERTDTY